MAKKGTSTSSTTKSTTKSTTNSFIADAFAKSKAPLSPEVEAKNNAWMLQQQKINAYTVASGGVVAPTNVGAYGQTPSSEQISTAASNIEFKQNEAARIESERAAAEKAKYAQEMQALLARQEEAQRASLMAGLDSAKSSALTGLAGDRNAIVPKYDNLKNTESISSQKNAKNFAEFMANTGSYNSGANAQGDLSRSIALQGAITNYDLGQASDLSANDRQVSDVNTNYGFDKAKAEAGLKSDMLNRQIEAINQGKSFANEDARIALEKAGQIADYTGSYNGSDTIQKTQADKEFALAESNQDFQQALAEAGLTGKYKGQSTLDGKKAILDNTLTSLNIKIAKIESGYASATEKAKLNILRLQASQIQATIQKINRPSVSSSGGGGRSSGGSSGIANAKDIANMPIAEQERQVQSFLVDARIGAQNGKAITALNELTSNEALIRKIKGNKAYEDMYRFIQPLADKDRNEIIGKKSTLEYFTSLVK